MTDRRKTFGPVILVGLAAGALAAVAGTKPWLGVEPTGGSCAPVPGVDYTAFELDAPFAGALALVLLAAWGVVLVTRGRFRRVVAGVGLLAAVGYLVTAIEAFWSLKAAAREAAAAAGADVVPGCSVSVWMNNDWWPLALVAGALSVLAALAAVLWVRHWPEMGARYDAPSDGTREPVGEPETNLDIWKALDEGRDPTA